MLELLSYDIKLTHVPGKKYTLQNSKLSKRFCEALVCKKMVSRHGIPELIFSDNGPQYSSCEFREFRKKWNTLHVTSSPHYPRSNGFAELLCHYMYKL